MLGNLVVCNIEDLQILVQNAVAKALGSTKAPVDQPTGDPALIDRTELMRRLQVTAATVIRWEKKGKIPCYRVGDAARYDWEAVKKALLYKA